MEIEFVNGKRGGGIGGGGGEVYATLAAYLDQQVSKAVIGQTATTDAIAGGHAVGKEHQLVRDDIKRADAKLLAASLNRCLVRPMIDLNKGPQKLYPRICIGLREQVNIDVMSKALAALVPVGLKVQMSEVRDKLGFGDPDKGAELLAMAGTPTPTDPTALARHSRGHGCAIHAGGHSGADAIDEFVDAALGDREPLVEGAAAGIEQLLEGATTIEEARDRLAEAVENMDVEHLTETLARAGFSAGVAGQLGIDLNNDDERKDHG